MFDNNVKAIKFWISLIMMGVVATFAVTTTLAVGMEQAEAISAPSPYNPQQLVSDYRGCVNDHNVNIIAFNASLGRCFHP
jgi:hypothetical protein